MKYRNPFNENMSRAEASEILFREIRKTTDRNRFIRLQADYVAVLPSILRQEINAFWDDLKSNPK